MTVSLPREVVVTEPRSWIREASCASWCQGCGYGVIQRIVAEVLDEMSVVERTVGLVGIGCASSFFHAINVDGVICAHGRAADAATAIKRLIPDSFVVSVQGDGDCFAIGTEGLLHAAARAEKITVIMLNNGAYAMTGGHLAPTTLLGQVTTTTAKGRDPSKHGFPFHVPELLSNVDGVCYSARGSIATPAHYTKTKKYVRTAFQHQVDGVGFSFLEILSPCPTNWHLTPLESMNRIREEVIPLFPLGEFKNVDKV